MQIRKANLQEKHHFYKTMEAQDRWIHAWWEEDLMCVVEKNSKIIWFVREVNPTYVKEHISVLWNVWIHEDFRGDKLWLKLVKFLINNIDNDIIWLDCKPSLEAYYNKLWFIKTDDMPDWFLSEEEKTRLIAMKLEK